MKKKHRDITVDGVKYAWTLNSYGKEKIVNVWYNKKELFVKTFRQPSVTPQDVADAIREMGINLELEEKRPPYGSLRRII